MARRLVEAGVRMVQVYYGSKQEWDQHEDIMGHKVHARKSDPALAALILDLKERGNVQAGVTKIVPVRERLEVHLRAEFFNGLNHANFNNPTNSVSSGGFGTIRSAADPRIGQLALKLMF